MKIAFICANPAIAARVGEILQQRWYEATITVLSTAGEGLGVVERVAPNLVIVHPDFSDMCLSSFIRKLRFFSNVPLLILSDRHDELEVAAALGLGADVHLQWPCNPMVLTARIQALLRRASFSTGRRWGCDTE